MASPSSAPTAPAQPPYYLLIAHSQPLTLNNLPVPASTSLSHPIIEYHYADDPPNALLPQYPGEHLLVLDYDPARPVTPTVKSLSPDLVVSAVKVTDAPGASVASEPYLRNNSIYVIDTMSKPAENAATEDDDQSVHAVLAHFKQRNAVLHRLLDYPYTTSGSAANPHLLATSPELLPQS